MPTGRGTGCPQIRIGGGGVRPRGARWRHEPSPCLAPAVVALSPAPAGPAPPHHVSSRLRRVLVALAGGAPGRGPAWVRPTRTTLVARPPGCGPGRRTGAVDPPRGPGSRPLRRSGRGRGSGERLPWGPAHHLPARGRLRLPGRPGGRPAPGHPVRRAPALPGPPLPPLGPAPRVRLPGPAESPGPREGAPPAPAPHGAGRVGHDERPGRRPGQAGEGPPVPVVTDRPPAPRARRPSRGSGPDPVRAAAGRGCGGQRWVPVRSAAGGGCCGRGPCACARIGAGRHQARGWACW